MDANDTGNGDALDTHVGDATDTVSPTDVVDVIDVVDVSDGSDASDVPTPCATGEMRCAGSCIDTTNDPRNCGGCGTACAAGLSCVASACVLVCPGTQTACGDVCVTLGSDRANCGACGTVCPAGQVCSSGTCGASCGTGLMDCSGSCRDTNTDPSACGGCGTVCPSGAHSTAVCTAGTCALACAAGFADCDRDASNGCEVDLGSPTNCGGCGVVCAFANAGATCTAGVCAMGTCNTGFADCNAQAIDGCEIDLGMSDANCNACGTACASGQHCVAGACQASCGADRRDCSGTCRDTQTDPLACGACGTACVAGAHSTAFCSAGMCGLNCAAGFADCDSDPSNGCETPLDTVTDCGGCGLACAVPNAAAACTAGRCTVATCNSNFADCNGSAADGCEANTQTDSAHCGACATSCRAGQACVAGACAGSCAMGYTDCSGTCRDLQNDPSNCGACGTACGSGQVCRAGTCSSSVPRSCSDALARGLSIGDGVYILDPSGAGAASGFVRAYCDMTSDGGGWTLVLKADGTQPTFTYDAPLWTDANLLNPTSLDLSATEAKLATYTTVSFNQLRVAMNVGGTTHGLVAGPGTTLFTSMQSAMGGSFLATTRGITAWSSLTGDTIQPNCNREGIVNDPGAPFARVRIGILGNNEGDCGSPDSFLGVGGTIAGNGCYGGDLYTVGQMGGGGCGGGANIGAFGYVFVRECTPSAEVCDGRDNDCDGNVDEGCPSTFYLSGDDAGPAYGTDGTGTGFSDRCPAGQVAIGFDGRMGCWLDAIQVVCGTPALRIEPATGNYAVDISSPNPLTAHGGGGGNPYSLRCPPNTVVTGISGTSDAYPDALTVICSELRLEQTGGRYAFTTRNPVNVGPFGTSCLGGTAFTRTCAGAGVVWGVAGNDSGFISQLQVPCTLPSLPLPPASSYTQSSTSAAFVDACALPGATTGIVASRDDATANIALPFPFTLYDRSTTGLWVSSNGVIGFDQSGPNAQFSNACIPNGLSGGPHLMPYWDDLLTSGTGICTAVTGTPGNQRFVITWENAGFFSGGGNATFSAVLDEATGGVDFLYGTVTRGGDSATVGVQGSSSSTAVSCNAPGSIASDSAIHFTPVP